MDFDDNSRLIGCIGWTDFTKAMSKVKEPYMLTATEIANKDCTVATLQTLDSDIALLNKYHYLPVVDSERYFQFYICDKSNWSLWMDGQEFEINYWRTSFTQRYVKEGIPKLTCDRIYVNDFNVKKHFLEYLKGTVIEIGAGPFAGYIWSAHEATRRVIIEPLADKYSDLREEFDVQIPDIEKIEFFSQGADVFIPELINSADAILCQNALDHTPDWPFVLGNIARYTKKGGILYLGTDIDHHSSGMPGHYNITYNPEKLYQLLNSLGFDIIYKHCYSRTCGNNFVTAVGIKY